MKLLMVRASPYARKVRVFAAERGLADRLEITHVNPHQRPPELVKVNPLSKVPTLIDDEGVAHIDSFCICLYLDTLGAATPLIPLSGPDFLKIFQRHALADGLMDCTVARRVESIRPPHGDQARALERDRLTGARVMDHFENAVTTLGDRIALDTITLACALSYVDFRCPEDAWRESRPNLARWHERFSARPSMQGSEYVDYDPAPIDGKIND